MPKLRYFILALTILVAIIIPKTFASNKIIEIELTDLTKEAKIQVECLADNIYHEAGVEPKEGQIAVGMVTLNRVQDPRYPKDICGVVKEKKRVSSIGDKHVVCQFSWYCMPVKKDTKSQTYQQSLRVALLVYANYEMLKDITHGALYYHADYVNPNWRGLVKTTKIGRHIFYKELPT